MLKGLLPTLRAKINQIWKKLQNQKQSLQKQDQNEALRVVRFNLLSGFQPGISEFRESEGIAPTLRKFILFLSVLFGFLLVLNYFSFLRINALKVEQDRFSKNILFLSDSEKRAVSVDRKISYYKEILRLRKFLSPKVSFVTKNIGDGITLNNFIITYPSFEITAIARNVYDFTSLIMKYLSGDYVSEVVLKSANFNTETKEYEFIIGGTFK